jgi:preprotein translocase subunit Sec63
MASDHYAVLGVARDAPLGEIHAAYRRLARDLHPDVSTQRDDARMARVNGAWSVLGNPARRAAYDQATADVSTAGVPAADEQAPVWTPPPELFVPHGSPRLLRMVMATIVLGSVGLLLLIIFLGFTEGAGT